MPAVSVHQAFVEIHNPLYTRYASPDERIKAIDAIKEGGGKAEATPLPRSSDHTRPPPPLTRGICRVGRLWTGKLPRATKVTLIGEGRGGGSVDRVWLMGRALLLGTEVVLGGSGGRFIVAATDPAAEDGPFLCTADTQLCLVEPPGRSKGRAGSRDGEDDEYIDDGAYAQLARVVRALSKAIAAREMRLPPLPMGFLLSGPPGVGKTHLVRCLARRHGLPVTLINGPEVVSASPGESEARLRRCFEAAQREAHQAGPGCAILFIDEIDAIAGKREESSGADPNQARLLAQLLTLLDGADAQQSRSRVIFVAATNRPNAIDPALRRPGRIDREIVLEPPAPPIRRRLLAGLLPPAAAQDGTEAGRAALLDELVRQTHGYVPADLAALSRDMILRAMEQGPSASLDMRLAEESLATVGPSIMREYKMDVPLGGESWASLGGLSTVREAVQRAVEWPLRHPEAYARLGLTPPRGILLHGPPGCSKTSIARVLAASNQFSFFSLDGASVFSCYLGEAERLIRQVFSRARLAAPSLIFIDELDALVGKRGGEGGDEVQERVLSTLLNEMDGIVALRQVLVMGATNRLEAIDDALKRPGRFDALIHVPLPSESDRLDILQVLARQSPLAPDVDLPEMASRTEGYSGASLRQLVQEAAMRAIRADRDVITAEDLLHGVLNDGE